MTTVSLCTLEAWLCLGRKREEGEEMRKGQEVRKEMGKLRTTSPY